MKILIYTAIAIIALTVGASALDNFLSTHVSELQPAKTIDVVVAQASFFA
ncbi:MAG: hypothetical protein ABJN04_02425 [Hyphomicrobiales bacterium]